MSTDRLSATLAAIDKANAADPNHAADGTPEALLYGQRMSDELARLVPDASDLLQVAVRGQHIERWTSPRASYPEGREGYLAWRRDLGAFHATRVAEIMEASGYGVQRPNGPAGCCARKASNAIRMCRRWKMWPA